MPLCAALYGPGLFALPPIDRDEPRYAQAARQMLESGDWTVPRVQAAERLIKPVGIYWLQAAALRAGGAQARGVIGAHRVPSALGALAAVLGTYWIGRRWFVARVAWLGAAWLAASALLVVEAHLATTDAVLLAAIVAAQGSLAALRAAARRGRMGSARVTAAFWLAQAAGILIKGPVSPLVSALTLGALALADRVVAGRLVRALRPWWGIPLVAACVAPWVIALAATAGWRALPSAMAADIAPKLAGVHESHGGPPGLYLLIAPATFWPGSLAMVVAVATAWRRRRRPGERFLLAWLVPTWLVFECVPTKLPNYVLPAFPALALLAARAALSTPEKMRPRIEHAAMRALWVGWAGLTAVLGLAPAVAASWLGLHRVAAGAALPALAAIALAAACLYQCWHRKLAAAAWTSALAAVTVYAPLLQWTLPHLDPLWISRAAAARVAARAREQPLAVVGYAEPSLVFLAGSDVALLDAGAAADFLALHEHGLVLVTADQLGAFVAATAARGVVLRNLWSERGVNYTSGGWVDLQLFTAAGPPSRDGPG